MTKSVGERASAYIGLLNKMAVKIIENGRLVLYFRNQIPGVR